MNPALDTVVQASAIVTASAATGTFLAAIKLVVDVRRIKRVVFGNDDVDSWDGLVGEVQKNRLALEEENLR